MKKQTQIEGTQQTTCTLRKCQYNTKTKELSQIKKDMETMHCVIRFSFAIKGDIGTIGKI